MSSRGKRAEGETAPIRVLIVEDHEEDAELEIRELKRSRFQPVWQRVDTEAAFLAALDSKPEVILCDYSMPELDAPRVLKALKATGLDIPFIVVSGSIGEDTAVAMMREGASDYLLKDRLGRLGQSVRRAIEERDLRELRREGERDLQDSEERFHMFMSHSPLLASIKDQDGTILYINEWYACVCNTTVDASRGKPDRELWPEAAANAFRANDQAALASGKSTRVIEEACWADGTVVQLLTLRFPYRSRSGGRLLGSVSVDITERIRVEKQLAGALVAKEVLLKEVHHRVKNNLQIISSLLSMQSELLPDPAMTLRFRESQQRVQAMAMIHERLYGQNDVDRLDFREYVEGLATELFCAYGVNPALVKLHLRLADVSMQLDQAIPCGLILNELLTNSLKYAFPNGVAGEISIELSRPQNGRVVLRIADTGVGLAPDFDMSQTKSLGLKIIRILTKQLRGELTQETGPGTAFSLSFEAP